MVLARPILTVAFISTLLFIACIGLIHAQPYDDSQLRNLLTPPDGCPMPCFMGIRPGVTTVMEAKALLAAHEWVSDVKVLSNTAGVYLLQWDWNGKQPDSVNAAITPFINVVDNRLVSVTIGTHFALGDILLELGPPDWSRVSIIEGHPPSLYHWLIYSSSAFGVLTNTPCLSDVYEFLHVPINIRFLDDDAQSDGDTYRFSEWVRFPPCGV